MCKTRTIDICGSTTECYFRARVVLLLLLLLSLLFVIITIIIIIITIINSIIIITLYNDNVISTVKELTPSAYG